MSYPTLSLFLLMSTSHIHSQYVSCIGDCNCPPAPTGTTCTLDCDSINGCQGHTLTCRTGDPCIVSCAAKSTCSYGTTIIGNSATDVTIVCDSLHACRYDIDIFCGTGDCLLQCGKRSSCANWGNINVSQSRSFDCIGNFCPSVLVPFTATPTTSPITTQSPTKTPTNFPSFSPTNNPLTTSPTISPTNPSQNPTNFPSFLSKNPSTTATNFPSFFPTNYPTSSPTKIPTFFIPNPSISTTNNPTFSVTNNPSFFPRNNPTIPTQNPSTTVTYTSPLETSSLDISSLEIGETKTLSNNALYLSMAAIVCCLALVICFMCFLFGKQKRKRNIIEDKLRNVNAKLKLKVNNKNKEKDKQIVDNISPSAASAILEASFQQSINQTHAIYQQQMSPRYYTNFMDPHSGRPFSPKRPEFAFPQGSPPPGQAFYVQHQRLPPISPRQFSFPAVQSVSPRAIQTIEEQGECKTESSTYSSKCSTCSSSSSTLTCTSTKSTSCTSLSTSVSVSESESVYVSSKISQSTIDSRTIEAMESIDEDEIVEFQKIQPLMELKGHLSSINSERDTVIIHMEPIEDCKASEIVDEGILKHVD